MTRRLAPVVLVLLAVSGCGGHVASNGMVSGGPPQVHGRLEGVGGPAPGAPRAWPGTVTLTADDGNATTVHTDADGRFHVAATSGPGHYTLTGHSPLYGDGDYLCRALHPLVVRVGAPVHLDVWCQMR
jgi:hypothetical protein